MATRSRRAFCQTFLSRPNWSETSHADDFSKNLIQLRTEGRWAFAVTKPDSFVVVDLTA